jgi:hypothetical protein
MSEKATVKAADQVAAQVRANVAIRNFLTPYKMGNNGQGDPQGYAAARAGIESNADPRIWQYQALKPGSVAAKSFLRNLTPDDRQALIQKARKLQSLGIPIE